MLFSPNEEIKPKDLYVVIHLTDPDYHIYDPFNYYVRENII